jgi:hypothetical protein
MSQAGGSDQGVFKLTQAMGGGWQDLHLLAFGLLVRHPELRRLHDRLLLTTANHGCRSQGNPAGR